MIDGHGDDLWRYGGKIRHNFSTNIHSAFDHGRLMAVIAASADAVVSYPEPEPLTVETAIAGMCGCRREEVMVSNGATEAIYLIAKERQGCGSAVVAPTFREYQDACAMHGHSVTFIKDLSRIPHDCGTVWLCNPNNPTGTVIPKRELLDTIRRHGDKVFVVDQAYSDYTECPTLTAAEAVAAGNVILLGSLTKRFAVPGLRIGYAIGAESVTASIKRWRMPWSVNGVALRGAEYLLANIGDYPIDAATLHSEAVRIAGELRETGITVTATDCNFVLCELPHGTSRELKEYLAEEAGILIRDASNFEGLGPRHFRVAAQSREENDLLIKKIRQWL